MNAPAHFNLPAPEADTNDGTAQLARRTRRAFILIGAMVFGLFGLAAFLQIGGAVIGSGEVAVESSVRTITHSSGGVLSALLVRDGDHVTKGQELLRFDTTVSQVGSQSAAAGLEQLLARRARLQAEREGAPSILFPRELLASADPRVRELVVRERRLFDLRRQERSGTLSLLEQRVRQYEGQIRSYEAQIVAIERQMVLIGPELEGLRKLQARQLVTINRVNEMERTAVQLEGSRAALTSTIAEARAKISETREQMLNVDKAMRSEAGNQLTEVLALINTQQVQAASTGDIYARSVIRAPQSGTIDKIAFSTIGSAIPPTQPIMQIVPDRDMLIVEARIRPQDVDQVRVGQGARVTFSGLNHQTTPDIPGKVTFVSAELTHEERTGMSFYRVKVRLDPEAMAKAPQVVLKSGMPAEVFVQTSNRSILSFLFKPLLDQLRYALREG